MYQLYPFPPPPPPFENHTRPPTIGEGTNLIIASGTCLADDLPHICLPIPRRHRYTSPLPPTAKSKADTKVGASFPHKPPPLLILQYYS